MGLMLIQNRCVCILKDGVGVDIYMHQEMANLSLQRALSEAAFPSFYWEFVT
jgi:hypothetical protein